MTLSFQAHPEPPLTTPEGWLILLHGWGANAQDLLSFAPILGLAGWQIYCLDAPFPHPQIPGGYMWYDLTDFASKPGLDTSRTALKDWIATAPLDLSRTVLAGFSQGGAMTLELGLGLPLAGLVVLSGYLHPQLALPITAPPILMIHGQADLVVPVNIAQASYQELQQAQISVNYQELNMGHEINLAAIQIVRDFILSLPLAKG
ncbi:alpha/beta hydrolase [Synechococcus sp. PCC 6312]|uniref:alpha/beta hydrolase n=1 Tax=Synechococcus sp. (strain ATCC 27167 / PCC 6312) TaxID=195253 RepID=UPI00029EE38F|nr:alpha/beta fold hydrolase [Synechococcus sp. PCC 6312]AFY60796.1 putative esterase [Synechococcus sp. PCC 6312]